jgi:ABC-type amino acid transport substrate-binding protein
VGDRNTLSYVRREFAKRRPPVHINIPSFRLREAFLAIPMREGHPHYKQINEAMLQFMTTGEWIELLQQWIGNTSSSSLKPGSAN